MSLCRKLVGLRLILAQISTVKNDIVSRSTEKFIIRKQFSRESQEVVSKVLVLVRIYILGPGRSLPP